MTFKEFISPFKNIWQLLGLFLIFNLASLYFFWPSAFTSLKSLAVGAVWGTTIWITQAMGNMNIFRLLDKVLPWKNGLLKRSVVTILLVGTYSSVAYLAVQILMFSLFTDSNLSEAWHSSLQSTWMTVKIAYAISFVITLIGFMNALRKAETEKERLRAEMMTYKYESLRNQINPHFLFNNFNVLSELVYEDQKLAVEFIRQLSDLYRYVLDAREQELVPLKEELRFIDSFVFLLKTRFEDKVIFDIAITPDDKEYIVPMTLQLLLENAIKHNEASRENPLRISVKKESHSVVVRNNLQRKAQHEVSTKIGLNNLRERYAFFDKELVISETTNEFKLTVPLLDVNSSAN